MSRSATWAWSAATARCAWSARAASPQSSCFAPAAWRALDACRGDRTDGPLLLTRTGRQMDRASATRVVKRLARAAGLPPISPHALRHTYCTNGLQAGVSLRDMRIGMRHADSRSTARYDHARENLDRHPNYTVASFLAGAV